MEQAALKFVDRPLCPNTIGQIQSNFRELGYAVLRNVFERDSVDAYVEQIRSRRREVPDAPDRYDLPMDDVIDVWPARAPVLLEALSNLFMPWAAPPRPVLFHPSWLIQSSDSSAPFRTHKWHMDADHRGVTTVHGYSYPPIIHASMYFTDVTPEYGPTYVIPRSHRDATLSPYDDAEEVPLLAAKEDVIVWDQRLWHRGSRRSADGLRIVAIFGFFNMPFNPASPSLCTEAQRQALEAAQTPEERVLFGRVF